MCLLGADGCVGGALHLRVVTMEGIAAFRVTLRFEDLRTHRIVEKKFGADGTKAPSTLTIERLPCGRYELSVTAPGFDTAGTRRIVELQPTEQWLTLAFSFEDNLDYYRAGPRPVELVGTVRRSGRDTIAGWVKLVGVYSNEAREATVDSCGTFRMDRLVAGTYIVIFTLPGDAPKTRIMTLKRGVNRVQF